MPPFGISALSVVWELYSAGIVSFDFAVLEPALDLDLLSLMSWSLSLISPDDGWSVWLIETL